MRPECIAELQDIQRMNHEKEKEKSIERSKKFLNNFYLYKGLVKYYDNEKNKLLSETNPELKKLYQPRLDKIMEYSKILTSNFQGNEMNVMRTFNCDPSWPICLYDFTYKGKSNEFSTMRCRNNLGHYVVDDYYYFCNYYS